MSHRFLNKYEERTYQRVWEVAEKNCAHVFPKVRLKDAISVNARGVSGADLSFALKAHLDFLVVDAEYDRLFAVEFDGPTHYTDSQQQRCDRRKNALMERCGLPLLRINVHHLERKFRDFDLLSYFVELWFFWRSYLKEEETKLVHFHDEVWDDPDVVLDMSADSLQLDQEIQAKIRDLFLAGQLASSPSYWIGQDDAARYRCIMWVKLPGGRCCFIERAMRHQQFEVGLCFILRQITAFDLFEQIQSVIYGECAARSNVTLKERLNYYASHFAFRGSCRSMIYDD